MLDFYDSMDRILIIKMAELAKEYKKPYDDMDREASANNSALKEKWGIYRDLLVNRNSAAGKEQVDDTRKRA